MEKKLIILVIALVGLYFSAEYFLSASPSNNPPTPEEIPSEIFVTFNSRFHNVSFSYPASWHITEARSSELGTFEGETMKQPIIEVRKEGPLETAWISIWDDCQGQEQNTGDFQVYGPAGDQVHAMYLCQNGFLFDGNVWDDSPTLIQDKEAVRMISKSFVTNI